MFQWGIGGAYIAGKLAYQKIQKLRGKKDDEDDDDEDENEEPNTDDHDGDEDGGNDAEDGAVGEEAETEAGASTEEAAGVGAEESFGGFADALPTFDELPTSIEGILSSQSLGFTPLGTPPEPATQAAPAAEEEFEGFGEDTPITDPLFNVPEEGAAPTTSTAASEEFSNVAGDSGLQTAGTRAGANPRLGQPDQAPPEEPDLLSSRAQAEQGTGYEPPEEFNPSPQTGELTSSSGESTIAEGTESTLETGTATGDAAAGSSAAAEGATAGSEILDTALTVGGAAAEAIPFLGIFAGIGIGLYELFHHPKKAPSAPPTSTASSKGEMVLPSFDSVTDTPASSSAF